MGKDDIKVWTMGQSVSAAAKTFNIDNDDPADLIPTGIPAIDDKITGIDRGAVMVLGADGGVGKSSVVLYAMENQYRKGVKAGYISIEDPQSVVGVRILAKEAKINSIDIRSKSYTESQREDLRKAQERLVERSKDPLAPCYVFEISSPLNRILAACRALGEAGCDFVWIDYVQKVRGHNDSRKEEVASTLSACHGVIAGYGASLGMLSQVSREGKLKETGDLNHEARIIMMLRKTKDGVEGKVTKSTFGGEGVRQSWVRDRSGTLIDVYGGEDW